MANSFWPIADRINGVQLYTTNIIKKVWVAEKWIIFFLSQANTRQFERIIHLKGKSRQKLRFKLRYTSRGEIRSDMIFCYGKWVGTSWAADAKFAWYQDQDTRFLLSMMVEFCRQSSNVLYLIIHLYVWILILQNATWSLWAIVFLTTIAAFCTLFAALEAILSHFVKFFKNHTVF